MGAEDFTLSAWLQGDPTMDQRGRIFDKGFETGYALGRSANTNAIGFEFLDSGSQGNAFDTTSSLIDGTWHHVALVKSGTTVTLYADGTAENSQTVSGASQHNGLPLLIGYNPGQGTPGYWKGMLDELKIFDRALGPMEIAMLAMNPEDGDYNGDGTSQRGRLRRLAQDGRHASQVQHLAHQLRPHRLWRQLHLGCNGAGTGSGNNVNNGSSHRAVENKANFAHAFQKSLSVT
jgi:hypothetical protein